MPCSVKSERCSDEISDHGVDDDSDHERGVIEPVRVCRDLADPGRRPDATDPAEARQAEVRSEEDVCDHREGERDHQEVDPGASTCKSAEEEGDSRRDGEADHDAPPWAPAEIEPLRVSVRNGVAEREPRDAEDRDLGQGDHPPVGGQEDQACCGDPEEEGLGEDRADEVVRHDRGRGEQRRSEGKEDCRHTNRSLEPLPVAARARGHAGLPKRPCGRNASTSARSANVKMIE